MAEDLGSHRELSHAFGDLDAVAASFEQQLDPVLVFRGPEHVFAALNAAGRRMFGHRPVLGRTYRESVGDADGPPLTELLDEAFHTARPVTAREQPVMIRPSAEQPAVQHFLTISVRAIFDGDGRVVGVTCHIANVTGETVERRAERSRTDEARQHYLESRDMVVALQRSLLPADLPVLPGSQLAARYLVAGSELTAGGDWFDVILQPEGRMGLVVGDVVGHGARASATMGQLRAVLAAYLIEGATVDEALARLDRFVARLPAATATTVCLGVLDPNTRALSYASCGHLPPLLIPAAGEAYYLPTVPGGPLGTAGPPPKAQTVQLELGDVLLLYTDGLIERADRSLDVGRSQLRQCAAEALADRDAGAVGGATVDRVCEIAVNRMTEGGYTDDVSLLGCELTTTISAPFHAELPAETEALATLRGTSGAWLSTLGACHDDVESLHLALGEAVANCIEHAYLTDPGRITVDGYLDTAGRACLTVSDRGSWRAPTADPGGRGRGLVMLRRFMDSVEVDTDGPGTTVLMERTLRRYPVLAVAGGGPSDGPTPERPFSVETTGSDPLQVRVTGVVDMATTPALRRHLERATRGGALPVTLDLTAVDQLASAAVLLLHELAEQAAVDDRPLRIIAPPGATASQVLELSGLDHLVEPDLDD
ncbi:SpoIIE family protein phosphatase [Actinomycetospora endophytica]|uniref:SpoIIE family protein phosphatase n=1 Tax=Actinomycetospora endophytica TaxID=2291215 RepID=A0ABS8P168_9PSEU|nr:SpoIIE family protein phosphatase [Actinomycetospora endophytica]MCD2191987.1 SpoIIE family protein phosphatase [Actinomycetospora endophytica]